MFQQIRVRHKYTEVSDQILSLVQSGNLKPGDQLPSEAELCRQLGVSRTPVREALKALELLGIIESKAGVGSFVTANRPSDAAFSLLHALAEEGTPSKIVESRLALEPFIASLAGQRRGEQDLDALERTFTVMEGLVASQQSTMEIDLEFHMLLAAAARNPVLYDCMHLIRGRMRKGFWQLIKRDTLKEPGRPAEYLEHHRQILQAVREGDGQAAEAAMAEHLEAVAATLGGPD